MYALKVWDDGRRETLIYLSGKHRDLLLSRYKQEWKLFFTTATFLVAIILSKYKYGELWNNVSPLLTSIGLTLLVLIAIYALFRLHTGNTIHKKIAEASENALLHPAKADELNQPNIAVWADRRSLEIRSKGVMIADYIAFAWQTLFLLLMLIFCLSRVCI